MVCSSSNCQGRTFFCYDCGIKLEQDHGEHACKPRQIPEIIRNPGEIHFPRPIARPRPRPGKHGRGKPKFFRQYS